VRKRRSSGSSSTINRWGMPVNTEEPDSRLFQTIFMTVYPVAGAPLAQAWLPPGWRALQIALK
jgi:hypothetical protein